METLKILSKRQKIYNPMFISALFSEHITSLKKIITFIFTFILPLTCKNKPLTDLIDKKINKYCLEIKIIYFCKKNCSSKNMFLVKRYFYSLLFLVVGIVIANSAIANNKHISFTKTYEPVYSISDSFCKYFLFQKENKFQCKINKSCKEVVLLNISEDNSLAKPFLELNFTLNFYLSELRDNDLKNKLGYCFFELITKSKTDINYISTINLALSEREKFSGIVNSDNYILFSQIQI